MLAHDGIEGRRLLAYRDTDRFVTAHTGLIPLSVSADRLAVVASLTARAAALGRTAGPDDAHSKAARTEGWIHLPTCSLAGLIA